MHEITVPAAEQPVTTGNLCDLVVRNAEDHPDVAVFARREGDGWADVPARLFRAEVESVARGLVAAGLQPGDRVAVMSRTRYEWTLLDFALWFAGAVPVPVYETSSAEQVMWILADSGAVAVVTETAAHRDLVEQVRAQSPQVRHHWTLEDGAVEHLVASGAEVPGAVVDGRRTAAGPRDTATIIYTSGTMGRPKGCELTHGNFLDLQANTQQRLGVALTDPGSCTLLFLPLAHVLARFIQVIAFAARVRVAHSPDIKNLLDDLVEFRPTLLLAVPRVFEKVYNSAEAKARAEGKGLVFDLAARTAVAYGEALDGDGPDLLLSLRHKLFDKLVFSRLRAALGGRCAYAVSGGAPLSPRLGHFFRGVGVHVLEGWGLTETTAPVAVNGPTATRIGTIGQPVPGMSVRVADDGELLVKGPSVMAGYWNDPAATAEAVVDGWFRTGDQGEIDADGYVRITGRTKEIIVTAGGKNVAPAVLEDRLRAHPLVSQCIVVGDQKPFVGALVTLDPEMLPVWLANNSLPAMGVAEAARHPQVLAEVQRAVDQTNLAVSRAESIRRFAVLDVDFTEAAGHLTPKLSLRRAVVMKEFADDVAALYA